MFLESHCLLSVTIILTFVITDTGSFVSTFGLVDFNDDCEFNVIDYSTYQSRIDQSKFCDESRGLYCVPGLGKCGCIVPHSIYRMGKCRAKIGNSCMTPGNFRQECVENARCISNHSTGFTYKCQCIRGYLSNAMKTSCFPVGWNDRRRTDPYPYGYGSPNSPYGWRGAAATISSSKLPFTIVTMFMIFHSTIYLSSLLCSDAGRNIKTR